MSKRELILDQEYAEFVASWRAERHNYPGGYVPARMLLVTGLMLRELDEAGYVDSDGVGYRPR